MAKPRKAPRWRGPFLRALARTGNVAASAEMAGVDKSTVYLRRKSDAPFAARWDKALVRGKAAAGKRRRAPKRAPVELILRDGKDGPRFVRAAEGRWSAAVEARFLVMLARTGCVRWAAASAGLSTTALYNRRKAYPDFAARWEAAEAEARRRIPGFLTAASIATFDPEVAEELAGEDLPKVTIEQGIRIEQMKGMGRAAGGEAEALPDIEAVRASILRKLDAIEAHQQGRD